MKHRICYIAALCLAVLAPGSAGAQVERYELGRRLGAFERAWDQCDDAQAKQKALAIVQRVTLQFLTLQFNEAGRTLDEARHALFPSKETPADVLWAESLQVVPATHLVDASETQLSFGVQEYYRGAGVAPREPLLTLRVPFAQGKAAGLHIYQLSNVPLTFNTPLEGLREGDHIVLTQFRAVDRTLNPGTFGLSVVKDLQPRLEKLRQAIARFGKKTGSIDRETVREIHGIVDALARRQIKETDYPAARLLKEAEAAVEAIGDGKPYFGGDKTGQFWLRLPNAKNAINVRLLAPDAVKEHKPLPLVIALHGLGGSENMFFDAYGAGRTVQLCKERGWILVAPGNWTAQNSAADLIEEVSRLYPVDKNKVFVVGHSLGARQAIALSQQPTQRIAAVAALGGGGAIKPKSDLRNTPFFVGVGTADIALLGARALRNALNRAGVGTVDYREYAGVEHVLIVRQALPDVFALFDKIAGR
jgi:pimeloyl-ACP methyl ester carboxylesterase